MQFAFTPLYIDPGTGSMLFTILLGIVGAAVYSVRMLLIKIRQKLVGGKIKVSKQKIPLVIFSESKRYWTIFAPICRELNKRGEKVLYITTSPDDPAWDCAYENMTVECIEKESKLFARLNYLNAAIVLATTPGLQTYQWKRSKNVMYYVHIPHAPSEMRYRMFGIDYYDAILVSGDHHIETVRALERLRNLPAKEMVKVGVPYLDETAKRLKSVPVVEKNNRTVLLAPSWGSSALFSVYGGKIIEKLLETGYHIIVRPHPQSFVSEKELMDQLMKRFPNSDQLEWNCDADNFETLCRSDILISDFSGVIFDFALVHNKPVIYTNPNFDVGMYDQWWLKTPLWTQTALPRIGQELTEESMENIKEVIDTCLTDAHYAEGLRAVREETWANEGNGAVAMTNYLVAKLDELLGRKEEK